MSFIEAIINRLSEQELNDRITQLRQNKFSILDFINSLNTGSGSGKVSKEKKYIDFKAIIKIHLPKLLETNPQPNVDNLNTWDDFILKVKELSFRKSSKLPNTPISNLEEAKSQVITYLQEAVVNAGLNTGIENIFSLLRVIPILFKQNMGQNITKAQLQASLLQRGTLEILRKIMILNTYSMNALRAMLWREKVSNQDETILSDILKVGIIYTQPQLNTLLFQSTRSESFLYNPENFVYDEQNGLSFSDSGEFYYKSASELNGLELPKTCPGIFALEDLCKFVNKIIEMIPENKFNNLIMAEPLKQEDVATRVHDATNKLFKKQVSF